MKFKRRKNNNCLGYKIIPKSLGFRFKGKMRPSVNSLTLFWMEGEPLRLLCPPGQVGQGPEWADYSAHPLFPDICPPGGWGQHTLPNAVISNKGKEVLQTSLPTIRLEPGKLILQRTCRQGSSGIRRAWNREEDKSPADGGFPGGAVVENLPANAGDTGSSPGLGRSHMPQSN